METIMSESVVRDGNSVEFLTRENTYITELLNSPTVPQTSLAIARVEAGVTTELHSVTVDEWYVIRSGTGEMELAGNAPFRVGVGDTVPIPAGTPQRIRNCGSSDLIFECVCIPRFTPDAYQSLE